MEEMSPLKELLFAQVFSLDGEVFEHVFKEGEKAMDQRRGLALCDESMLESHHPFSDHLEQVSQHAKSEHVLAHTLAFLNHHLLLLRVRRGELGDTDTLDEDELEHQGRSFRHHCTRVVAELKCCRDDPLVDKGGVTENMESVGVLRKQFVGVVTNGTPRALQAVDQEHEERLGLEELKLDEQVDWLVNSCFVQAIRVTSEQVLDKFEDIEEGVRAFNGLVKVQVSLTVFDDAPEEVDQREQRSAKFDEHLLGKLAWVVLPKLFTVDGAQSDKEDCDALHELLAIVRESGLQAVLQEDGGDFVFPGVHRLRGSTCLDHRDALEGDLEILRKNDLGNVGVNHFEWRACLAH